MEDSLNNSADWGEESIPPDSELLEDPVQAVPIIEEEWEESE